MLTGMAAALYPTLLPSNGDPERDITIYNAAAGEYAPRVGLVWSGDVSCARLCRFHLSPVSRQGSARRRDRALRSRVHSNPMEILLGALLGLLAWFVVRVIVMGFYTVDQNERAVKTSFGRAQRIPDGKSTLDDPIAEHLSPDERERYKYPLVRVIPPGGPYFKAPWERIHKVSIATMTVNMALDLEDSSANQGGTRLEAVTKDQLNTGLTGQIRYRVSESNLYAFLFGIKQPFVHVLGYFVSVLRQRIASFEAPPDPAAAAAPDALPGNEIIGISINDLRKNLRDLNEYVDNECR